MRAVALEDVRLPADAPEGLHPVVRAELPHLIAKLNAAGYDGDFEVLGAGQTGLVLRETRTGHAFKVARDAVAADLIFDEYEFLTSLEDSEVARFLPRVYEFDWHTGVLIREGVEGRPGGWGTQGLREVYDQIVEAARARGWGRPEFKENSFIVRDDGSIVMVDVGFTLRRGTRLVQYVERVLASETRHPRRTYADLAWELRMDAADGLIPQDVARELQARMERITGGSLG